MDYLGLFCLGVFVGTIATFGMVKVDSIKEWRTVLSLTLPAVLSGAAMVFMDRFKYSPAFGAYPLGLAVALAWAYVPRAVEHLNHSSRCLRAFGVLHITGAVLATFAGVAMSAWPAYQQVKAEVAISTDERKGELLLGYAAARDKATPASAPTENK